MRNNAKQQKLADFETSVLSSIWDAAQDILQQGGVTDLLEVDRAFWTSRVFDGQRSFEVEILLDGKRIKGFTCDCWSEHRNLMCKHVAAAAGALRQYLHMRELERQEARAARQPSSSDDRLNIATILKRTPPEAIIQFVQEYAADDKAFATLLKSRFASWLSGEVNYYKQIIQGLVPEKHSGHLTMTEQRKVQRIIDDLVRQQKAAVAEHDLQKAWLINSGLIEALPRLIDKMLDVYSEPFRQIFQDAYLFVLRLSPDHVSPELWEQRRRFLLALIDHSFLHDNAIRLLIKSVEKDELFWLTVEEKFQEAASPVPMGLLTVYAAGLVRRKMGQSITDVIKHFVPERDRAVRLILQLYHLEHYKEALACGTMVAGMPDLSLMHKNTLGQVMLSCAEKLGDTKLRLQLLQERLVQSNNLEYYDAMKSAGGEAWPKYQSKLIASLTRDKEFRILALVYMHDQNMEALYQLIQKCNDFTLLHQIERPLIIHQPHVLHDMYVYLCKQHLEEHFGVPSADFIRSQLLILLKVGGADVARSIVQSLTELYPDRAALQDCFSELFPKHRKMIKPRL